MVLGKAYKENLILIMFVYFFLLIASIACSVLISIYLDKLLLKITIIVVLILFIVLLTYFQYAAYKNKKTPDSIIIYNAVDETITINTYKKTNIELIYQILVLLQFIMLVQYILLLMQYMFVNYIFT